MRAILVGGVFDDTGGRKSGYVERFHTAWQMRRGPLTLFNGGTFETLQSVMDGELAKADVVLWFADVPNDKPKLVDQIKKKWPKVLLVTSKRNFGQEYPLSEIVGRALKTKSNLVLEMTGARDQVEVTILDPLGTAYCLREGRIGRVVDILSTRLRRLQQFRRVGSQQVGPKIDAPDEEYFYKLVREQAERFHEIIHGVGLLRFGKAFGRYANPDSIVRLLPRYSVHAALSYIYRGGTNYDGTCPLRSG